MTEPSEDFHEAKAVTIPVNPARLAWGKYDHARNRDVGKGDIRQDSQFPKPLSRGKLSAV